MTAQSTWKRHALGASVSHVDKRAIEIDQDRWATSGSVNGRIDLFEDWSVSAGALRDEEIVEKHHPAQFIGNLNGRTVTDGVQLGVKREDADSLVSLQGTYQEVDNETEIETTAIDLLEINDREEIDLTLQAGPKFAWGQAYVKTGLRWIDYAGSPTPGQVDRNSHGFNAGVGVAFQQGSVSGRFEVIGFHQDYETATIGEVTDLTTTGEMTFQLRKDFAFGGLFQRSFDEQATAGSAGLYTTTAAVGAIYQPLEEVYVQLGPTYRFFRQEGVGDSAQSVQIAGKAAWQVHDRAELTPQEAWDIYRRNRHHLDEEKLNESERRLLHGLEAVFGPVEANDV